MGCARDLKDIDDTIQSLQKRIRDMQDCDGIIHKNFCIKLLYSIGSPVDRPTASSLCVSSGGTLAEIDDDALFYKVYAYLRSRWIQYTPTDFSGYVHVWLGMQYLENQIVFSDGRRMDPSAIGYWHLNSPRPDPRFTYITLLVCAHTNKP